MTGVAEPGPARTWLAALAFGATQAPAASTDGTGPRAHLAANGEPASTGPQAPANDEQADAQAITSLLAALHGTTVGATVAPREAGERHL